MTVVIAWREGGGKLLWVVSDSRLSDKVDEGQVVLTDHGAKVLEIPVALHAGAGSVSEPALRTTFGFAYAGSSLIALQAYTAVLPLWSRLAISGPPVLPSIDEFAQHLAKILGLYARGVGASGSLPRCACLLIGYDLVVGRTVARSIEISPSDGSPTIRDACTEDGVFEILGSNPEGVRSSIETLPASTHLPFEAFSRRPLRYIRETLKASDRLDIGGGVQIGIATQIGFELNFDAQPSVPGYSIPDMRFRGVALGELSTIGPAFVDLRGVG